MKQPRLFVAIALGLALALVLLWVLRGPPGAVVAQNDLASVPSAADTASTFRTDPLSLARPHDPVVIAGSVLTGLMSRPVDEIFVYAYQDTTLTQIPFQIDERNASQVYVPAEDGQLDDNDELIFMAADAGGWADRPWLNVGGLSILPTYVITLTDPISQNYAWAYVFHSAALSSTFTGDYVSYDAGSDRIAGLNQYALGFDANHGFLDSLALSDGGPDLLDRVKLRIVGTLLSFPSDVVHPLSINEENVTLDSIHALDGPVRVTRVSTLTLAALGGSATGVTTLYAYRSLVVQLAPVLVPGTPVQTTYLRTSMDWNEQATGMIFHDANNAAGVTIDGVPDAITVSPPTKWTQMTGDTGTVINVSAIPAGLGGIQSTYYKDESTVDSNDTGDQRSYGDAGCQVRDPVPGIYTERAHIYFLTGAVANVGSRYASYYDYPLQVSVGSIPPVRHLHLPIVTK